MSSAILLVILFSLSPPAPPDLTTLTAQFRQWPVKNGIMLPLNNAPEITVGAVYNFQANSSASVIYAVRISSISKDVTVKTLLAT